jgi:hypothetical protein
MIDYPRVQPGDLITADLLNRILEDLATRTSDTGIRLGPLARGTHTLVALGTGLEPGGGIWLDGSPLLGDELSRGLSLVILDSALALKFRATYDTHTSAEESRRLAADLRARATRADVVAAVTHDAYLTNLESTARAALGAVGAAGLAAPATGRHNAAFIGAVPSSGGSIAFDYLTSVMPPDATGSPAGLAFVWGIYSTPMRRFLIGSGAGGLGAAPGAPPEPAATIALLELAPRTVVRGGTVTGRVAMRGTVAEDTQVTLTSSNPRVASVPDTVHLPEGKSTSATFPVTTNEPGPATITASLPGSPSRTEALSVESAPPAPATLASLGLSPRAVQRGTLVNGTVVLSGQVGAGTVVQLTSSNARFAQVPESVAIPPGQDTSATFQVTTPTEGTFRGEVPVSITASLAGSAPRSDTVVVLPNEKDRTDSKQSKDDKDNADNKQSKDTKDNKDNKEGKDNKDDKDNKEGKENKDRKDSKDDKDKDAKDNRDEGPGKIRKDKESDFILREAETTKFTREVATPAPQIGITERSVSPFVLPGFSANGATATANGATTVNGAAPLADGRSFIRAEERPELGRSALADTGGR